MPPQGQGIVGGVAKSVSCVYGDRLILGGAFTQAGALATTGIAAWNGSSWAGWGMGVYGLQHAVGDVITNGGDLVIGGNFTHIDGTPANNVGRWDGVQWHPMGTPPTGVLCLTSYNGSVIAGGGTQMGVSQWDGASWIPLGSGATGANTDVLAVYDGSIIAGGNWLMLGGYPVSHIARWDGAQWVSLGSGLNGTVSALTTYDGALIAGGGFTAAGAVPASYIARWDGQSWSPLGSGMNGPVCALTVYNGRLIAAGDFTVAGTDSATRIAAWDGETWSALGSGLNNLVYGLGVYAGSLYAAGLFTTAGGLPSFEIARWTDPDDPCMQSAEVDVDGEFQGWTPSGMDVVEGEALWIRANGSIVFAPDGSSNTDGCRLHLGADSCQCRAFSEIALVPNAVHGSLVGRINGGTPFFVGHDLFLQCSDSGPVEFAYNDQIGDYFDNSGFFHVSLCLNPCGVPAGLETPHTPGETPASLHLATGGPNPFTRDTMVSFTLPADGHVVVDVVDLLGRRVAALVDDDLAAGTQHVRWDGADGSKHPVAAGAYYLRVRAEHGELSRKVVLVR